MAVTLQGVMRFMVGLTITAAILFLIWYFSSVVIYILVSAVLAIMGRPVVSWLLKLRISGRTMPRWAAASITLVVIMAVLLGILSLFIPLIFSKINEFAHLDFASVLASVEEPIAHAQAYMQRTFAMPETSFSLTDTLATKIKELINYDTLNNTFSIDVNVLFSVS